MGNIASMSDVARIAEVNCAARLLEVRKDLFQRVNEQHDIAAFGILYELYFGDIWAKAFHPRERRAMQGLLTEYLDFFLTLLERKGVSYEARFAMARCLQKFLPGYPDIFQFDSLEKRIVSAMVGESDAIFRTLDETLVAVKKRFVRARENCEPD